MDKDFLSIYLNEGELKLFHRLKKSEKNHSIAVAKGIAGEASYDKDVFFIKAALLHDIGKIEKPLNLIEKSLAVLLNKFLGSRLSRYDRLPFIGSYLHHGQRGEKILRSEKIFHEQPLMYTLVGTHHLLAENIEDDAEGRLLTYHNLLKKHDDRY